MNKPILSFDIEEWFHLFELDTILPIDRWDEYERRAKIYLPRILELLKRHEVTATFFFLGWVAERQPRLVEIVAEYGHEIASHGYAHQLVSDQDKASFDKDIKKSNMILREITGQDILGYRAPGFSITKDTPWAFDVLIDNGFKYDSSIFPAKRDYGCISGASQVPYLIEREKGALLEFPQSVVDFKFCKLSFFGGGYFRLFPSWLIEKFTDLKLQNHNYASFYLNPREMDTEQPRLEMSLLKTIRSYINISKTEKKLRSLLEKYPMTSYANMLLELEKEVSYVDSELAKSGPVMWPQLSVRSF